MTTIPQAGTGATHPLLPEPATIIEIITETPNIRTYRLVFDDPAAMSSFTYLPGQIGQLGILGVGESTFAISSPPSRQDYIQFSVMKVGVVTGAIHELSVGDKVAVRAPMGCAFPIEEWKGKNILIVAGGIGMAPLRSLLMHLLDHRQDYGRIEVFYGARTPADLCYVEDRREWEDSGEIELITTVDAAEPGWTGRVGMVPDVLTAEGPNPDNAIAITCGPPIMIKYALLSLDKMGFREEQVYTTLERRMKCGIGICGRCNIGARYVCRDGPVFSLKELRELPDEL